LHAVLKQFQQPFSNNCLFPPHAPPSSPLSHVEESWNPHYPLKKDGIQNKSEGREDGINIPEFALKKTLIG